MAENPLFNKNLLGKFPKITSEGIKAINEDIRLKRFHQFCLDGWAQMEQENNVLFQGIERVKAERMSMNPDFIDFVDRTPAYAAGFIYQILHLQAMIDNKDLPQVTPDTLRLVTKNYEDREDRGDNVFEDMTKFLLDFDEQLAVIIGNFINRDNPIWKEKQISREVGFDMIYYTLLALFTQVVGNSFSQWIHVAQKN